MSIKIYNGYTLSLPNKNIKTVQSFCKQLSIKMNQDKTLLVKKMFAEKITAQFDQNFLDQSLNQTPLNLMSKLWNDILDRQKQITVTNFRDPEIDFEVQLCLIPLKTKLLVLYWGEREEFLKTWKSTPGVQEYHYQNSTDRPENISSYEWRKRKNDWASALPNSGNPKDNGLVFTLVDNKIFPPRFEEFMEFIPSLEQRAASLAKHLVLQDKMKILSSSLEVMAAYMQSSSWLRSEDGKAAIELKTNEIKSKLKPQIDKVDVYGY